MGNINNTVTIDHIHNLYQVKNPPDSHFLYLFYPATLLSSRARPLQKYLIPLLSFLRPAAATHFCHYRAGGNRVLEIYQCFIFCNKFRFTNIINCPAPLLPLQEWQELEILVKIKEININRIFVKNSVILNLIQDPGNAQRAQITKMYHLGSGVKPQNDKKGKLKFYYLLHTRLRAPYPIPGVIFLPKIV